MTTFAAQTFQNEYLPVDGSEVNAIVTVTCSVGGAVAVPQQRAEVIIVDVSGSMLHPRGKLKAARAATLAAIDCLPDGTLFGIIAGASTARRVYPPDDTLLMASESTREAAKTSVAVLDAMGGTAIGTGLNAPAGYAEKCATHLASITGLPIYLAPDLIEATQDTQAYVLYSSCMKSLAIKLSKVCNDLRLLSSGPRCGLREINLPAKQPGSSIMPGKVNPVIPEVVNMVCFRVIGSDLTVTMAAEAGQLQLNVFEPVIAACIFEAQTMFMNAVRTLRVHCVDGITANADVCSEQYSDGSYFYYYC